MAENCATCKFMRTETVFNAQEGGHVQSNSCRYNPPMLAMTQQGPASLFPPTQLTHWCGKYEMALVLTS